MKKDPLKEFGRRLESERLKLGFSQERLALEAGLDRTYVAHLIHGRRNATILNVLRLATVLGIEPGVLLHGIKVPPKEVK